MKLPARDFEGHFLRLALNEESEFPRLAGFAYLLLRVRGGYIPEIVAGIQAGDIRRCAGNFYFPDELREHVCSAYAQSVRNRIGHWFPFKVNTRGFRVIRDDRRKVARLERVGGSEHIALRDGPSRWNGRFLVSSDFHSFLPMLNFRTAAIDYDFTFPRVGVRFDGR